MNYLQKFQQELGLANDGVIGKKTAEAMMRELGIVDRLVYAHLMGQMQLESGGFTHFRENMNYNAAGLLNIFRKYYKAHPELAGKHERKPELIANYVYANRNGNGDEASGDGWKYRGTFGLQLTGRANIVPFFESIGLPKDTDPDSLKDNAKVYFQAGLYWFDKNHAASLCTAINPSCSLAVSRLVNLGNSKSTAMPHDWELRADYTRKIAKNIGVA